MERAIKHYRSRADNVDMEVFATLAMSYVDDVFQSEGATSLSGAWEPLSETTLILHPRRIGGLILQDTGATANIQLTYGPDFVDLVAPTDYAQYHLTGTKHMPKRDFFDVDTAKMLEEAGAIALAELE